ncbi:MAG: hypothetical protein AAFW81_11580 [Pseudomonadota bacterium]
MMSHRMGVLGFAALFVCGAMLVAPEAKAKNHRPLVETDIARIVGGAGYGFCEFTRRGRRVTARVHIAGMDFNSVGTAWIFVDGANVGQLDGTIATEGGDAAFYGSLKAPRYAEVKIDVRDHRISIETIGNSPGDEIADDTLVRELTTPAPHKMGTCSTTFE